VKTIIYNQKGEEVGTTLLPKEIFDVKINSDLVHRVTVSQMANRRKVVAHTKGRGEVRGGGRKPWRQKGTGRARHGSIRSPLWRGGGVTFGPRKEKIFKKKIPKKMKRKALFMVLSDKFKNNLLIVLDELKLEKAKTKFLVQLLESLKVKIKNFKKGNTLIALPNDDKNIILAARNLPEINTLWARDLNTLDVLSFKYLILPKDSIKVIKDTFTKR
jgi:large subunit ribosomal protein L4